MAKLFLMMGCPGSGKSTWCSTHLNKNKIAYISRDAIRFDLVPEGEEYFSKEDEVFNRFISEINSSLKIGMDVYADATHLTKSSRWLLLKNINTASAEEVNVIWIKTPLEVALQRNEKRTGRALVPKSVVKRMFFQTEEPSFEEGFRKIYIIEDNKPIIIREEDK